MNGKMEIPIAASPNIVLESIRGVLTFDLHSKKDKRRKRVDNPRPESSSGTSDLTVLLRHTATYGELPIWVAGLNRSPRGRGG